MNLAEALRLANQQPPSEAKPYRVFLGCGFMPLHLKTFLIAHLLGRTNGRPICVETGLYGDLPGSLRRAPQLALDAAAVVLEWADLDARLSYRSPRGWRSEEMPDVLKTVSARLDQLLTLITTLGNQVPVAFVLPTLPLPPAFRASTTTGDATAFILQERLQGFAARLAAEPIRVLSPQKLDLRSTWSTRLDVASEIHFGFPYTCDHASTVGELLAELLRPRPPKKGLITDLDNTFWRGILGEDGVDGVSWDLDHGSHVHALYQGMLSSFAEIGVLVGVATKNDPDLVKQALQRKDLLVNAEVLFPVVSHWRAKSESVGQILQAWNIGADSVVLVDDSPMEIAEVQVAFPQIEGIVFPTEDEQAVSEALVQLRDLFGKSSVTEEDRIRIASLRDARPSFEAGQTDPDEFLAQVEAKIEVAWNKFDQRSFELINKTNQFNLNGRRLDEAEWKAWTADADRFLLTGTYTDKFGPLGKIAVMAGRKNGDRMHVDVWVMSCRAFSRRIEHHMLKAVFDKYGVDKVWFDYVPNDRNGPLREFLEAMAQLDAVDGVVAARDEFLAKCPKLSAKVEVE
jgi:FkbH-like protein